MPQGLVLGPLLYVLYIAELELIVARHGLHLHMYADDCQVYLNTSVEDVPLAVNKFAACVADINAWLSACPLRLNAAKTSVVALLQSACGQGRLPRRPGARHSRRHLGHCWRPRCCHWRLSLRLQPATPALTSSPIVVRECHQNARTGVHLVSPGLLQLTAVRHQRRTTSSTVKSGFAHSGPKYNSTVHGMLKCRHVTANDSSPL